LNGFERRAAAIQNSCQDTLPWEDVWPQTHWLCGTWYVAEFSFTVVGNSIWNPGWGCSILIHHTV